MARDDEAIRSPVRLPIACALTPGEIASRKAGLLPGLVARATSITPQPDGYRVVFEADGDTLRAITETIDSERTCCPFLRFTLTIEPASGPVILTVTGPPGTQEFLSGLLEDDRTGVD